MRRIKIKFLEIPEFLYNSELYKKCLGKQNYIVKTYMNLEYMRSYIQNKVK